MKNSIVIIAILLATAASFEITLTGKLTCLDYVVEDPETPKMFSFHCDQGRENVRLNIYGQNKQLIASSGEGLHYESYIDVKYSQTGNFQFCFYKGSDDAIDVSVDIFDEIDPTSYAGKEDVNKVARRISSFLVDIRKIGFELKEVLSKNIKVKQQLKNMNWRSLRLTVLKVMVMCIVIIMQVFVVKKIFI